MTIHASRSGDALNVRARVNAETWRLVRVPPLAPDAAASADLTVHFTSWTTTPADESLHPEDRRLWQPQLRDCCVAPF